MKRLAGFFFPLWEPVMLKWIYMHCVVAFNFYRYTLLFAFGIHSGYH